MLETIIQGRGMMIPLMVCSVIALAVLVDRILAFYENSKVDIRALRSQIMTQLRKGQVREAALLCVNTPGPVSAVLLAGLQAYMKMSRKTTETVRVTVGEAMEDYARHSMNAVEKRLWVLATVGNAAPLFGMTGTVTGMITSFKALAKAGMDAAAVGTGISEALITTAGGLMIALGAVIPYSYFTSLSERLELDISEAASEILEFLAIETERIQNAGEAQQA